MDNVSRYKSQVSSSSIKQLDIGFILFKGLF